VQEQDELEKITYQDGASAVSTAVLAPTLYLYSKPGASPLNLITSAQVNTSKTAAEHATTTLTDPEFGLMSSECPEGHRDWCGVNLGLNAWAVWVVGQTASAAAKSGNKVGGERGGARGGGEGMIGIASIVKH
jgi:hypothetical protein